MSEKKTEKSTIEIVYECVGMKIQFGENPIKWSGSIRVKSRFKSDYHYVTSTEENFIDAINQISERHKNHTIISINISREEYK